MPYLLFISSKEHSNFSFSDFLEGIPSTRHSRRSFNDFYCTAFELENQLENDDLKKIKQTSSKYNLDVLYIQHFLSSEKPTFFAFDMDSTLINQEVIDEIAKFNEVYDEVARVTEMAMQGEMDFDTALRERCKFLKDIRIESLDLLYQKLSLQWGVREFLAEISLFPHKKVILSGGFTQILKRFAREYGFDSFRANVLEVIDGKLTGNLLGEIVNQKLKQEAFLSLYKEFGVEKSQTVALGDGSNDFNMLSEAEFGIGFHPKEGLKKKLVNCLEHSPMYAILFLFEKEGWND
ncbi:MAG: phosphoserine phosphatase SerB [Leptospiraceae bacterium]|nr:phosphoserine phosphatase SerB [Leptospiraceae bacterium]MCP5511313.1 phosphoserine phosphatase SerB [Leptospiraceae bacterium]